MPRRIDQQPAWLSLLDRLIIRQPTLPVRLALGVALGCVALGARYSLNFLLGDRVPWFTAFPAILLAALMGDVVAAVAATLTVGLLAQRLFVSPGTAVTASYFLSGAIIAAAGVALRRALVSLHGQSLKAEEARRAAELALATVQESERRKDEFLAMLAHELRNPLAPIRLILDVAQRRGMTPTVKQLDTLDRQSATLAHLVDDLLDVARVTQGKIELRKEPVAIASVASRAVDALQPAIAGRQQRLEVSLPEESLWVEGDPVRLEQVLVNLLANASKFTPPGGHISLKVRWLDTLVELRVEDDGEGLASEDLERVFELFAQVKQAPERERGGLGLGLKIARSLVERHGGRVRAESAGRGRGSHFIVELPLSEQRGEVAVGARASAVLAQRVGLKVLIVDDNVDVAESLREVVEDLGHATEVVFSGPDAIAAVQRFHPDLVFLDLGLPGLDGYEVARQLKGGSLTAAPLVAISGYGASSDRAQSMAAGFSHHLVKPVKLAALAAIIEQVNATRQLNPTEGSTPSASA